MKTALLIAALFTASVGMVACAADAPSSAAAGAQTAPAKPIRVLAFSKTGGFRHGAQINLGHAMLKDFAGTGEIVLDAHSGEKSEVFTDEVLKNVDVVVFLNTTDNGKVPLLNEKERAAFEAFIKRGGGFVGIHAASDAGRQWPFFGEMVGAHFAGHPAQQDAQLIVVNAKHIATAHLPASFKHHEEWYNFDANIHGKPGFDELLRVDEATYKPTSTNGGRLVKGMGEDHPIAWTHEYAGGRCFYTELGHTTPQYKEEWFRKHVLGGIEWAAGRGK